jgi:hypothetical protein
MDYTSYVIAAYVVAFVVLGGLFLRSYKKLKDLQGEAETDKD